MNFTVLDIIPLTFMFLTFCFWILVDVLRKKERLKCRCWKSAWA
jgi:hypothetical protein